MSTVQHYINPFLHIFYSLLLNSVLLLVLTALVDIVRRFFSLTDCISVTLEKRHGR